MDDIRHDELAITASDNPRANASDSSPKPQKARSVEVDEDMAWQRRTWAVQRLGWLVMGGLVLIALTGVFGHGPVSWQQASDPAGLVRVEYERFERQFSERTLRVDIAPQATVGDALILRLNEAFLDAAEVKGIVPEPREARSVGSDVEYVFPVAQPGQPATIRFALKLRETGSHTAEIGLVGREPARFTQFVYP
ncbi:hypothetical protein [Microvirga makkahensis]|uniref:Uncharacterized protein n=1 Tax=Microvirga makkahensis TaxID=1128670 RepID=A0A7X3SMU5_9HYPH|nr:hypothetical protein [Microvirga makkahensis]MXQ10503.1 hypothetical protein [Microvirga makkahensis]